MTTTLRRYSATVATAGLSEQIWNELCLEIERASAKRSPLNLLDDPLFDASTPLHTVSATTPPQASFSVVGVDGKFVIAIANPQNVLPQSVNNLYQRLAAMNAANTPLVHNLQSCTTVDFDLAHGLVDYGISSQLTYTYQNPNVTLFWRLRSSYDGKTWNQWQIYSSALTCGPVGVYSGLLSTPALCFLDSQAMTSDGSVAISQHGATTQIDIAGKTWNVGPVQITYNAGSVDPGAFGLYYIYANDPKKAGGTVTYIATQNLGDLTAQDGNIMFGSITTVIGGGGTGGHGGFCCIGGVQVEMLDGSKKDVATILKGDVLLAPDGGPEVAQADALLIPAQPCFSITMDNGIVFGGASSGELLRTHGDGWSQMVDLAVGDVLLTKTGIAKVKSKTYLGERAVYQITLDRTRRYYGDGIVLHNMKIGP